MLSSRISRLSAKAPTACSSAVLAQPGCKVRLLASRFFVFESARSHHHIEHVDELLSLEMTAQPVGTVSQQPITEEHALALDPVDTHNILEVDDLGMGTEEVVLHDRLDAIGIDAYSLENAGTLIVKQQRVVIHARHPHGVR